MLFTKMNEIIDEVNGEVAEREELIECIALCLLAGKNLFILGDTGQAKSYAINEFRKRITGSKQFERLMSKQTDEEQIFGRLDLSSLIPGSMPKSELMKDDTYRELSEKLEEKYAQYKSDGKEETLAEAANLSKRLEYIKHILCTVKSGSPKMITDGKIPDSHIVFLDEIFKSGDGILNSLLTALNERVYTNEGQTIPIPVISFFSASNEIPDFKDSSQAILKPLYDRFELKVLTEYVQEKDNRLQILRGKQSDTAQMNRATITLDELYQMQKEVEKVIVPDSINELMDEVLCELRRNGIHVSDRKFFGFAPIVQAKAYLNGNREVTPKDLLVLKNYFWNSPEEIPPVGILLSNLCENRTGTAIADFLNMSFEAKNVMDETLSLMEKEEVSESDKIKAYSVFSNELLRIYKELSNLKDGDISAKDQECIDRAEEELEGMLSAAAQKVNAPYVTLADRKVLSI